jgi:transposase
VRVSPVWAWRLLLGGFAVVYLASATLQQWVPPLLPFLAAAAVEAQFFVSGLRARRTRAPSADPGPQARDLADLGWASRTVSVRRGDAELLLRPGELRDEEIAQWIRLHDAELDALGPGCHELAAIESPESPVARLVVKPGAVRSRPVGRRLLQVAAVLALFSGIFLLDRSGATWQKLPAHERAATLAVMTREAAAIAGHPAEVMCDVSGRHVGYVQDADGLAEVGGRRIWLTPGICYRLAKVRRVTAATELATGHAIAVLGHEAWHLHGERSEAVANCYAYQSGVQIGQALGLSAKTARRLMHEQLADNPSDYADAPAYVVPSGCRRGGALDLALDGTHFP